METNNTFATGNIYSKSYVYIVAFFWSLALTAGVLIGVKIHPGLYFLIPELLGSAFSVCGSIIIYFVALILLLISIHFRLSYLIIFILSVKGFIFGVLLSLVSSSYQAAAWLVYILLLVPYSIFNASLLRFLIDYLDNHDKFFVPAFIGHYIFNTGAVTFYTFLISPFVSSIISHY